jgi:hypothetical protein
MQSISTNPQSQEIAILPTTSIARSLVAIIGVSVLLCMTTVVYYSNIATKLEFKYSVANGEKNEYEKSESVRKFRERHIWSWGGPLLGLFALFGLVIRNRCSLRALVLYVCGSAVFTVYWLTYTLFVIYLANQNFWV